MVFEVLFVYIEQWVCQKKYSLSCGFSSSNKNSPCFKRITKILSTVSIAKLEQGVLDGPQIRRLIQDTRFVSTMNHIELEAWESFVDVAQKFLGNVKDPNYVQLIHRMLKSYRRLGCRMSVKCITCTIT